MAVAPKAARRMADRTHENVTTATLPFRFRRCHVTKDGGCDYGRQRQDWRDRERQGQEQRSDVKRGG